MFPLRDLVLFLLRRRSDKGANLLTMFGDVTENEAAF